jgi:hypothetical protein
MFLTLGSRASRRRLAASSSGGGGSSSGRETLTADRTYYVRTDGSDSNNGLSDHSGGAFASVQKALNVAATIDFNGFTVTIQVGVGTFSGQVVVGAMTGQVTAANLILSGSGSGSTTISSTGSFAGTILATGAGARVTLQSLTVTNGDANGIGIQATNQGQAIIGADIVIGAVGFGGLWASNYGIINVGAVTLTFSANLAYPFFISPAAFMRLFGSTVALGTRTVTATFLCSNLAYAESNSVTYTGTVTGKKYHVEMNGVLQSFGATLPGASAGTTATGGLYG